MKSGRRRAARTVKSGRAVGGGAAGGRGAAQGGSLTHICSARTTASWYRYEYCANGGSGQDGGSPAPTAGGGGGGASVCRGSAKWLHQHHLKHHLRQGRHHFQPWRHHSDIFLLLRCGYPFDLPSVQGHLPRSAVKVSRGGRGERGDPWRQFV